MISPARWAAFDALRRADPAGGSGKDLASALATTRGLAPDPRDRALATEIALGVERWRAALDATIAAAAGRDIGSIDPPALIALRMAVFQLTRLTRTPAHAVVDDAVAITKRAGAARAAGFVNAVLRTLLRGPMDGALPPRPEDAAGDDARAWTRYLSITLSHPAWLASRWIARHGTAAAEQWARVNNEPAPLTLRVNTARVTMDDARARLAAEGVETEPCLHAPHALTVTAGNPMGTSLHAEGLVALMDEASQLVGALAAAALSGTVLDACAAPGGKTLVLACDMRAGSRVVAADRRPRRVSLLTRSLARFGLDVPVIQHDLAAGAPFRDLDGVLVDAPCSGLGTIRRDPDIRWRRAEADLGPLAAAQLRLLHAAADAVRRGGRVVYATCSSEPEENEQVAEAFLAARSGFVRAPVDDTRFAPFLDAQGDFRTLPHRDRLESFYAAVLARTL